MAATAEVLPAGNEWEFSDRNRDRELRPDPGIEITQPTGILQELAQHVQERFIVKGWKFAVFIQDLLSDQIRGPHLIAVFTHPSRVALVAKRTDDIDQFIQPEEFKAYSSTDSDKFFGPILPAIDPINQILKGTNLVVYGIGARYNEISVKNQVFRQTGVGCFDITLETSQEKLSDIDEQIEEEMKVLRPLQEGRAALLALQFLNPVPLFQTR